MRLSVTVVGGGAVASDSIARDFRRRFLASMKDTSHACRNDSRSTGLAFSSKPLGTGGRSAGNPSSLVSLTVLAPWRASRCAAPGVKLFLDADPNAGVGVPDAPAPNVGGGARADLPPVVAPPAMFSIADGVNAVGRAPPSRGRGEG